MRWILGFVAGLALAGCFGFSEDPILRLSAVEALAEGKSLLEQRKFNNARPYLLHAFEIAPNTVEGREGLLLAADALFQAGGHSNWVKSQTRYRDYLNRFPTSAQAAYAQYQIGMSIAQRLEKPDRDQSLTGDALSALRDVRRLYPTSEYAERAEREVERIRNHAARHDLIVGRFYQRYQRFGTAFAAIDRFEALLEEYPTFPETDETLLYLCRAYAESRVPDHHVKAVETCGRLREEFPESRLLKKMPKIREREVPDDPGDPPVDAPDDPAVAAGDDGL